MNLVGRLRLHELQIAITRLLQVAGLNVSVRHQLIDLAQMRVFAGFLEQREHGFQSFGIVLNMGNDRPQRFRELGWIVAQQLIRVLLIDSQCLAVLLRFHQSFAVLGDRGAVVVHRGEFDGEAAGIFKLFGPQIGLEERAKAFGVTVEVADLFQ